MNHGDRGGHGDREEGGAGLDKVGVTGAIIGLAIKVHRALGPGLLEHVYDDCLAFELGRAGFDIKRQVVVPLVYEGMRLSRAYRIDMIVDDKIVLEIKSIDQILPLHEAQVLTYLRLSGCPIGLLMNFNVRMLKEGIRRVIA